MTIVRAGWSDAFLRSGIARTCLAVCVSETFLANCTLAGAATATVHVTLVAVHDLVAA